jgi:threonine synthase
MRSQVKKTLAIGAAVLASIVVTGVPAEAHERRLGLNGGKGYAVVASHHRTVSACDTAANDRGVWVDYATANGISYVVHDPDGDGGRCGVGNWDGSNIVRFRLCERDGECTPFRNA